MPLNVKENQWKLSLPGPNEQYFNEHIDSEDLWCSSSSHEKWVTDLSVSLIEAGCGSRAITDVLQLCRVKVRFNLGLQYDLEQSYVIVVFTVCTFENRYLVTFNLCFVSYASFPSA